MVQLRISNKLVGREKEVSTILRAFEQGSSGRSRVLLVTGYSGIGKTALVGEAQQLVSAGGATFVSGKFDQFNRGTPYDSLIQAFRQLICKSLADATGVVAERKAGLGDAMGNVGRALLEVIPELEELIGPQPELDAVSPEEARNRFQIAVSRLVSFMASHEHPLVIFLDDLQWADLASLDLIVSLATEPESQNVLLIGAYRENEVDVAHPLTGRSSVCVPTERRSTKSHSDRLAKIRCST